MEVLPLPLRALVLEGSRQWSTNLDSLTLLAVYTRYIRRHARLIGRSCPIQMRHMILAPLYHQFTMVSLGLF